MALGAVLAVSGVGSPARAQDGFCTAVTGEITSSLKQVSYLKMQDTTDDSAPRAAMRASQATTLMDQIGRNMDQLKGHYCADYPYPVSEKVFQSPAALCAMKMTTARMTSGYASESSVAGCDQSQWQPDRPYQR